MHFGRTRAAPLNVWIALVPRYVVAEILDAIIGVHACVIIIVARVRHDKIILRCNAIHVPDRPRMKGRVSICKSV